MTSALGGTEVHDLWSEAVGDTFRIFVGHCGDDPRTTLLLTDGNGFFGLAVDSVRLMQIPALVPSMLVVGIGYPGVDHLVDTVDIRVRDLTPTPSDHFPGSGGAPAFLRFITDELRPWLAGRFPRATGDVTGFGHSLGGLFGTYVSLTAPEAVDRHIISSPSLWWDDEVLFEAARAGRASAPTFFGIGSLETDEGRRIEGRNLPDGHPAKPPSRHLDMVDDLRRFVELLSSKRHGEVESIEVPDEFHATVPGIVLARGLRHFGERVRGVATAPP